MRRLVLIGVCVAALTAAACTPTRNTGTGGTTTAPGSGSSSAATVTTGPGGGATTAPVTAKPATKTAAGTPQGTWKVRYNWNIPSTRVGIDNPHAMPLPRLAEIHVGNHEKDGFARISFYFRDGMPSYNFNYAREVLNEGQGEPIKLEGNSFLRIQFSNARQHDDESHNSLKVKPANHIGFTRLRSYAFGGDFEGYVTYGLGIQSTPNSDHILKIRVGELTKKPDGKGGFFYVVAFDVAQN
ncbi:AMIN-like domain-containing (lipo)protein [Luedemannella helvata]|uniref:AMIN-like domain-containing protein n=1 Tax=Luedemannella helvata TaxID=349315 RepID=A0ABP4W6S7_9ACTN